jgi:hypothetical protein
MLLNYAIEHSLTNHGVFLAVCLLVDSATYTITFAGTAPAEQQCQGKLVLLQLTAML